MNSPATPPSATPTHSRARRRLPFWLIGLVFLFVLVPFLFWRGTWFGRPLSEQEMQKYFSEQERPRRIQHALVQVGERILRGDSSVKRWYPRVQSLAAHEQPQIRATAAWVMGQDNQSAQFHAALLGLMEDPDPVVRRNAALSLVRFGDASGRGEIRGMLLPYAVPAPAAGTVSPRLQEEDTVNLGTLLGRIRQGDEEAVEVRSPLPGRVERWLAQDGERVSAGDTVVLLSSGEDQVWEALRALYLIGERDDLPAVEPLARGVPGMPEKIRRQARLTAEAIRQRAAGEEREVLPGAR